MSTTSQGRCEDPAVPIREFLAAVDARWQAVGTEPITLQLIGSAALMLQCDYDRGTKDGDILESKILPPGAKAQLLALADKGTDLLCRSLK